MIDAAELKNRITPTHLLDPESLEVPTDEDLKGQVSRATAVLDGPANEPTKPDPRGEKSYTFQLDYEDARGKKWAGQFTNKILNIHERQKVGTMRAMLSGGQPFDSLDELTSELNLMVAHLAFSLTEKPKWAANLRALEDYQLLQAIYEEVNSHESYFLGWGPHQKQG